MSTVKIHEQQKEWAIKAAVGIIVFLFCYGVMIAPVFQDISTLRQSIMSSQTRRDLYQEVQSLKKSLDSNESVLVTLTERAQLLGKISDVASQTKLYVETLTPRTEPNGGYVKLRMEMEGKGNFFSLLKFLQEVEKIGAAIKVTDVSLLWKPSFIPKEGQYLLQIQLVFETFLKQRTPKKND